MALAASPDSLAVPAGHHAFPAPPASIRTSHNICSVAFSRKTGWGGRTANPPSAFRRPGEAFNGVHNAWIPYPPENGIGSCADGASEPASWAPADRDRAGNRRSSDRPGPDFRVWAHDRAINEADWLGRRTFDAGLPSDSRTTGHVRRRHNNHRLPVSVSSLATSTRRQAGFNRNDISLAGIPRSRLASSDECAVSTPGPMRRANAQICASRAGVLVLAWFAERGTATG